MARVEIKEWFRSCPAQRAFSRVAQTSETSDTITWVNGPAILPIERWDGETFYEVNHSWNNSSGPPVFGNLRGEYNFKYASNSSDLLSPVVGAGTGFIELTLDQVMKLMYRAKLIRPKIDWEFSGSISSAATGSYSAIDFEFEVATDELNVAGTPSSTLGTRTENMIYCGAGFTRWNTLGTTPSYLASINYELFEDPDEFFIGTGTGSIIQNPNQSMSVSSLGGATIQTRAIDNPRPTVYQVADEPEVYFVPASQLWPLFFAGASCIIGTEFDGSFGETFTLRQSQFLIETSFIEGTSRRDFYDDFVEAWITDFTTEQEVVASGLNFSFFGDPVNNPGVLKSATSQLAFTGAAPALTNSTTLVGDIDIEAQEYWEYTDDDGNPLYDKDTGAQL
jgi:hypothetical protein